MSTPNEQPANTPAQPQPDYFEDGDDPVPAPIQAGMEYLKFCNLIEAPIFREEYQCKSRELSPREAMVYNTILEMLDVYFRIRVTAWKDILEEITEQIEDKEAA